MPLFRESCAILFYVDVDSYRIRYGLKLVTTFNKVHAIWHRVQVDVHRCGTLLTISVEFEVRTTN